MSARFRMRWPSPALIVACLALFAALGGSTYAATSSGASGIHWTNAALKNGWTIGCCTPGTPGYAKDSSGVVHLRGAVAHGSSHAFVLPSGLRPKHYLYISIYTGGDATGGYLFIEPNGEVSPSGGDAVGYASLNGVSFVAGQ